MVLGLSIGSLVVAVLAASFAGAQVVRMRQAWQAQNALEVARDLDSEEQREARRALYGLKAAQVPYIKWKISDKETADRVLQRLNTAAYLADKRLLPPGMLEENWSGVYRNVYRAAEDRIAERDVLGATHLWRSFRVLAMSLIAELGEPDPFFRESEEDTNR